MKKYSFKDHIYVNLIALFFIVSLFALTNYLNSGLVGNLIEGIFAILIGVIIFYISSSPLLLGLYIAFKYLSKTKILKILQLIFIPLIGALVVPLYFEIKGDEHWTTGLAVGLFSIVNFILYLINETYLFANFKHLKKLK